MLLFVGYDNSGIQLTGKNRIDSILFLGDLEKNNHKILATLQYKQLYNISRSEIWGKKIQATAYNGARTVFHVREKMHTTCAKKGNKNILLLSWFYLVAILHF